MENKPSRHVGEENADIMEGAESGISNIDKYSKKKHFKNSKNFPSIEKIRFEIYNFLSNFEQLKQTAGFQ